MEFMVAKDGQQTGPFNMEHLKGMVASGELTGDSMVWKQGMENWEKASTIADLASLFTGAGGAASAAAGAATESAAQAEPTPQPVAQATSMSGTAQILPNSTGALVLGILSLVFMFCYALPGLILGIIGLSLSKKAIELYESNPGMYQESGFNNAKAGKICSLIGVILSSIGILLVILWFIFVFGMLGAAAGSHW